MNHRIEINKNGKNGNKISGKASKTQTKKLQTCQAELAKLKAQINKTEPPTPTLTATNNGNNDSGKVTTTQTKTQPPTPSPTLTVTTQKQTNNIATSKAGSTCPCGIDPRTAAVWNDILTHADSCKEDKNKQPYTLYFKHSGLSVTGEKCKLPGGSFKSLTPEENTACLAALKAAATSRGLTCESGVPCNC